MYELESLYKKWIKGRTIKGTGETIKQINVRGREGKGRQWGKRDEEIKDELNVEKIKMRK